MLVVKRLFKRKKYYLVLLIPLFHSYIFYGLYHIGLGIQSDSVADLKIQMDTDWYPYLNLSPNSLLYKVYFFISGNKLSENVLIFEKPHFWNKGPSIHFYKIKEFEKFYSKATKNNLFVSNIKFKWGNLEIADKSLLGSNLIAGYSSKYEMMVTADSMDDFSSIINIKGYQEE